MNQDFVELLRALCAARARFLVVGAYAVTHHSRPPATGDLDLWVEASPANAAQVHSALKTFGAPIHDLREVELATPGFVYQIGVPPRRIDVLTSLTGIMFEEAWPGRSAGRLGDVECPFIGKDALVRNKRALGRPRDLADLELLSESV